MAHSVIANARTPEKKREVQVELLNIYIYWVVLIFTKEKKEKYQNE